MHHALSHVESAKSIEVTHVTRKPRFPDMLASCLHHVASVSTLVRKTWKSETFPPFMNHAITVVAACMGGCMRMLLPVTFSHNCNIH
jgi:hypothetical protein